MTTATIAIDRVRAAALKLRRAFDARARRERLLLIGAAVAVVWMLGDSLWLTPAFKEWAAARARQSTAAAALQRLNAEIAQRGNETRSAEQQLRGEITQARERIAQGDAALRAFGATLVGAAEMVPMLDRLLAQSSGVRLRSMQTLPRSEVGAATPAAAANTTGGLYRHGVELSVEGGYADVLAYVRAIESMPQHVLWGGLQLKVEQHPKVVVTLRLYTLSPDRNWLEI
jgi:MSHA biogenesis protein MshJ